MKIYFMDINLNNEACYKSYSGFLDHTHVRYDDLSDIVQVTIIDILCVRLWQRFREDHCHARAEKVDSALKMSLL